MEAWTIIQNEAEYKAVINRIETLSVNPPALKTEKGRELLLLGYLADQYEEENFSIKYPNPIEAIKVRMNDLNLTIGDVLPIFGDRGTASKVFNGERALSLNMIRSLSEKLSLPAELLLKPIKLKKDTISVVKEKKTSYKRYSKKA